jgi:MFS family permease
LTASATVEYRTEGGPPRNVLANPRFLALYLSQLLTQVGGNMVLYGLTITVSVLTGQASSVGLLLLTFLVPAVIFGTIGGVYSDQFDRRKILVICNFARGICFIALLITGDNVVALYVIVAIVATLTTFFGPAEAAMIPSVVDREQLMQANGLFVFTLQASFVVGFAVLGPLFLRLLGPQLLIVVVAGCYLIASALCWVLPPSPPTDRIAGGIGLARRALAATGEQLVEGVAYIKDHRSISWSLAYLAITASLIGVLGTLGPAFAKQVLGLSEQDFVVVVLPLAAGLVVGILTLNVYGKFAQRRRLIEGGLLALGISLAILGFAQRVQFLRDGSGAVSLLTVVMAVAFSAGVAYSFVVVPAQTQLQEELPSEVRGRVFGVLNTLVSLASFVPIVLVSAVADKVGTPAVIILSAIIVLVLGTASVLFAHPLGASGTPGHLAPVDPVAVATSTGTSISRPVRLSPLDEGGNGMGTILLLDQRSRELVASAARGRAGGVPAVAGTRAADRVEASPLPVVASPVEPVDAPQVVVSAAASNGHATPPSDSATPGSPA